MSRLARTNQFPPSGPYSRILPYLFHFGVSRLPRAPCRRRATFFTELPVIAGTNAIVEMRLGQVWNAPEQDVCRSRGSCTVNVEVGVNNYMLCLFIWLHQRVKHCSYCLLALHDLVLELDSA